MGRSRRRLIAACLAVVLAFVLGLWRAANAATNIEGILESVRANERLYQDIEAVTHHEYEDLRESKRLKDSPSPPPAPVKRAPPPPGRVLRVIVKQDLRIRYVSQQGMFHLERQGKKIRLDEDGPRCYSSDAIRLFDGATTRLLEEKIANIAEGWTNDGFMIRPHMLLLRGASVPVPLSTYLSGDEAMLAYPHLHWDPRYQIRTEYLGDEVVDNRPCHKVAIRHVVGATGELDSARVLWLAKDRNYLPLRYEGYTYAVSKIVPVSEGIARDLREIASGIWYPFDVVVTRYDGRTLAERKQRVPGWRERNTTEKVVLKPHYPMEFFRDLEIPVGTLVHAVDSKGNITRSYVKGGP